MKLNEAINKDLLAGIPNFDDWKFQQTPEYADQQRKEKKRKNKEAGQRRAKEIAISKRKEKEREEREEQDRIEKLKNISQNDANNKYWWGKNFDEDSIREMLKYATITEDTLEHWAETISLKEDDYGFFDEYPERDNIKRAKVLIDHIGSDLSYGNKALSILRKSPIDEIRRLAQKARTKRKQERERIKRDAYRKEVGLPPTRS